MLPSKTFINYADYMLAITDKFWHHSFLSLIFQFVRGLYISAPAAVDLQLNPSRASAVENVRISSHHGSWRGYEACSGSDSCTTCGHLHPAHLEDPWRTLKVSNKLFLAAFTSFHNRFHQNCWAFHIRFDQNRWERLVPLWISPLRYFSFHIFSKFPRNSAVSIYYFM